MLPVPLSGSALTTIVDCPLRWFLQRRAGGETPSTSAIGFGMVLHTLADAVATGTLPPDVDELNGWLDKVWTQLEFESTWISDRERVEAEQALRRFVAWHQGRPDRTLIGTEVDFDVLLPDTGQARRAGEGPDGPGRAGLRGHGPGGRPEDRPHDADQAGAGAARAAGDLPARDRVPASWRSSATTRWPAAPSWSSSATTTAASRRSSTKGRWSPTRTAAPGSTRPSRTPRRWSAPKSSLPNATTAAPAATPAPLCPIQPEGREIV